MAVMKKLVDQGLDQTLEAGLVLEREVTALALRADDVSEGLAAFRARRAPDFGGCADRCRSVEWLSL